MNGLVSIPPPAAPCPEDDACQLVHADGWFTPIDLGALRATMRVGTTVTDARLREAVLGAMASALKDLAAWRTARALEDIDSIDQVPGLELDGASIYAHHWRRAVYNFALAELSETHRDVTATGAGDDRADARALSADEYRRDALHAIRDILGSPRIDVELL